MSILRKELDLVRNEREEEKLNVIRTRYDRDLGALKEDLNKTITTLKFTPDWEAVKKAYASGAETVRKAFFAVHGDDLVKIYNSKVKLGEIKKKTSNKPAYDSIVGNNVPKEKSKSKNFKNMSYDEQAQRISFGNFN